jgi:uncharacterized protein (DUF3820 family)
MKYEVFPFGKYNGVPLRELPSTYIVLAIEKFTLPEDLRNELARILAGRLGVYSSMYQNLIVLKNEKPDVFLDEYEHFLINRTFEYENDEWLG